MKRLGNQKGFTLIELIMVIVILGILAAVAIPKYISVTKQADYAAVQAMVGALNGAAGIKFAENRILAETGRGTAALLDTTAKLGAQLDPAYSTTEYPDWTLSATDFIYKTGKTNTWSCTFAAETAAARAKVTLPVYE